MTVFTITFNEEIMLPHFIAHYRRNFPDCRIVVYDNESSDNTVAIAQAAGCEVISYSTNGQLSDAKYLEIKNNVWKTENDWVIIADCDELCEINETQLQSEAASGTTWIRFEAYNMVNMHNNFDFVGIIRGIRTPFYDKVYCFDARAVTEVNYTPGAHQCMLVGPSNPSQHLYRCFHYAYLNPQYKVKRYRSFAARLSEENKRNGWGTYYLQPPNKTLADFAEARKNAAAQPMILPNGIWPQDLANAIHQSSQALAAFMAEYLPADQPVIDFGCGIGFYLHELSKQGYKCKGVEGFKLNNFLYENIEIMDLTQPIELASTDPDFAGGSVISLEVGEHLPAAAQETFMQTITHHCTGRLIFSWAEIGQPGIGHINCRDQQEVIDDVCSRGFVYMRELSEQVRATIEDNTWWFRRTLLIFERAPSLPKKKKVKTTLF